MDKLEHYLDRVCLSIGGPKSLRGHVRQELREHLLDAVARHKATGLSQDDALARALDEFGGPEELQAGLEEAHGRRLLPILVDRAMQWKEKTLHARWFWNSWAYATLGMTIALLGVMLLTFLYAIFPKINYLQNQNYFNFNEEFSREGQLLLGLFDFWKALGHSMPTHWETVAVASVLGLPVVVWFASRIRHPNKSMLHISVMGGVIVFETALLMSACLLLVVLFGMTCNDSQRLSRTNAHYWLRQVEGDVVSIEKSLVNDKFEELDEKLQGHVTSLRLVQSPPHLRFARERFHENDEKTTQRLNSTIDAVNRLKSALQKKDKVEAEKAIKNFHEAFDPPTSATQP